MLKSFKKINLLCLFVALINSGCGPGLKALTASDLASTSSDGGSQSKPGYLGSIKKLRLNQSLNHFEILDREAELSMDELNFYQNKPIRISIK
ncbi:MAG: hypothetical protein AB8E15_03370 [Bdellovibrionales bacterium]